MRTPGSTRDKTWPAIREASINLIYEQGFEAMNTRQLAESVNMKPGSLYYYFDSKEALLNRLVTETIDEIISDLIHYLEGVPDPLDKLDTFVSRLVQWHVTRQRETHIARLEIRSLSEEKLRTYMASRDQFDEILGQILTECEANKSIEIGAQSLHLARLSILTMITGITSWYRPGGESSPRDITAYYVTAVRRLVGAKDNS